ncbi:GNAT family N-acetyltransferase [Streptomyces scopuliridis]|uniref:GNAT family N-acetyltransferase n=1 Tax=Streptomyces scopuliridis TaxID=452529 RepID=UPI0036BB5B66
MTAAVGRRARQSGATTLKLAVIPDNEPAVALYQRNGFVVMGELGDLFSDGVTRECVMVKSLG